MDGSQSKNTFVPRQALTPTPQLYDELVGDSMEQLAVASIAELPPFIDGSVVHDNGCGTGPGSSAIRAAISGRNEEIIIKATDILDQALDIYKANAIKNNWPAEALIMDSQKLSFEDNTFSHVIANALLFVLPNDGIDAVKESYRTLKPGGSLVVNSWNYVPNLEPLRLASNLTRPPGTPSPRMGMEKWSEPGFVQSVLEKGGFEKDKIIMSKSEMHCTVPELTHFVTMLWSFIGGTSEVGWLQSDEEKWDEAIEILKKELKKTDGFMELDGGRAKLKFVANIAVAKK